MKIVRVYKGAVVEIIPEEATNPSVAYWYGEEFASLCVEAPDEVQQHWTYDSTLFYPPKEQVLKIEDIRALKISEISAATEQAIKAGVDVTTAYGQEHFGLEDHDQINISNLSILLATGASHYLYHADGKVCVLYSAADLQKIVGAALQWVTYHTTYNNFMKAWIKRETNAEVVQSITFGSVLPEDLQAEMDSLLALVGGGSS